MIEHLRRRKCNWNGSGTLCGSVMNALPSRCYSGYHKATDQEDDLGTPGREIWRKKCGQQVSDTAGGRWIRKQRTELDREVVCDLCSIRSEKVKSSKSG